MLRILLSRSYKISSFAYAYSIRRCSYQKKSLPKGKLFRISIPHNLMESKNLNVDAVNSSRSHDELCFFHCIL